MLPLQPKLLPGYNLQSSFLSSTLSTVRPPDLNERKEEFKPSVEVIVEKRESIDSSSDVVSDNLIVNEAFEVNRKDEINCNIVEVKNSAIDDSPNNNSY